MVDAVEPLEYPLELSSGDPDSIVLDGEIPGSKVEYGLTGFSLDQRGDDNQVAARPQGDLLRPGTAGQESQQQQPEAPESRPEGSSAMKIHLHRSGIETLHAAAAFEKKNLIAPENCAAAVAGNPE